MSAGLAVSGATVRIGGATLLDDVGFTVARGRFCAIAGPNGAGKTTLLHLILGLLPGATGEVRFDHADLRAMPRGQRARTIAFVEHAARTELPYTTRDVVALGRIPHATPNTDDAAIAERALALVGLSALAGRDYGSLSGGEQQRVQIARALAQEPRLLLLDEPTSHLDLKAQVATLALLREQARAGMTVVAALHDLTLAAAFCDDILFLKRGRVAAFGPPHAIIDADLVRAVYDVPAAVTRDPETGRLVIAPAIEGVGW